MNYALNKIANLIASKCTNPMYTKQELPPFVRFVDQTGVKKSSPCKSISYRVPVKQLILIKSMAYVALMRRALGFAS